jgi:hypothetical protein
MILDKGGPKSMVDLIKFETNLVEELKKNLKELLRKSLMLNVHD